MSQHSSRDFLLVFLDLVVLQLYPIAFIDISDHDYRDPVKSKPINLIGKPYFIKIIYLEYHSLLNSTIKVNATAKS